MSIFKNHYDLYDRLNEETYGRNKFLGLVSKICSYLEADQIFELYNSSRDTLERNTHNIGEQEIFSAIVLNVTKLVMNQKLKIYEVALESAVDKDYIKKYVFETLFFPWEKERSRKIEFLKASGRDNDAEIKYLEKVQACELERFLPELKLSNNIAYGAAGHNVEVCDSYALENDIIGHRSGKIFSSLFHENITADSHSDGTLAKHYKSEETIRNSSGQIKIKNNFLNHLKASANKKNNNDYIVYLAEKLGYVLSCQEIQEMKQDRDWMLTENMLDFVCSPETKDLTTGAFFADRNVQQYITPTKFKAGKLYVHALKESDEINLMAKYLIENVTNGRIRLAKKEKILTPVHAIMPKEQAYSVQKAFIPKTAQYNMRGMLSTF
ncbi:MAG: hypothetical protein U9P44_02865 [archaeon]|nr:hypothetical protein [archaeon]